MSSDFLNCDELAENYKKYDGEPIDCQFHYYLTEFNDQSYIELNAHCADLTRAYVINENCTDICIEDPYNENSACGQYLKDRKIIEVLLIEK